MDLLTSQGYSIKYFTLTRPVIRAAQLQTQIAVVYCRDHQRTPLLAIA
jgi:hypothetical protein